jgi:hypothetical protein
MAVMVQSSGQQTSFHRANINHGLHSEDVIDCHLPHCLVVCVVSHTFGGSEKTVNCDTR